MHIHTHTNIKLNNYKPCSMIAPSFLVRASFSPLVRLCCFFMTLTRENIVNYDRAIKYDNRATLCTLNVIVHALTHIDYDGKTTRKRAHIPMICSTLKIMQLDVSLITAMPSLLLTNNKPGLYLILT